MKLERDHTREGLQPAANDDQHWRALCPLAVIKVYQRRGEWQWKIITSRSVPFVSRDACASKEIAWAEATARLASLARAVLADLQNEGAAEESATHDG